MKVSLTPVGWSESSESSSSFVPFLTVAGETFSGSQEGAVICPLFMGVSGVVSWDIVILAVRMSRVPCQMVYRQERESERVKGSSSDRRQPNAAAAGFTVSPPLCTLFPRCPHTGVSKVYQLFSIHGPISPLEPRREHQYKRYRTEG